MLKGFTRRCCIYRLRHGNLLSGMQYAYRSLVCTPGSELGQMARQRKGETTPGGGSSSDAALHTIHFPNFPARRFLTGTYRYSVSRLMPNSRASAAFESPSATRRRNSAARVGDNDGFLPVYFPNDALRGPRAGTRGEASAKFSFSPTGTEVIEPVSRAIPKLNQVP